MLKAARVPKLGRICLPNLNWGIFIQEAASLLDYSNIQLLMTVSNLGVGLLEGSIQILGVIVVDTDGNGLNILRHHMKGGLSSFRCPVHRFDTKGRVYTDMLIKLLIRGIEARVTCGMET